MAALQANGIDDDGIKVCFSFASPSNRAATGPFERFSNMVKKGYPELVNCKEYAVHDAAAPDAPLPGIANPTATFLVSVSTVGGGRHMFTWHLSRQSEDPFVGVWMVDGVQQIN